MRLAWELGYTEKQVEAMTPDEFARWVGFFKLIEEQRLEYIKKGVTAPF